jgi:hypothetical protein
LPVSATVVIDLDDWPVADDEQPPRRRPPARGVLIALVLGCVLLLVGGSTGPRPAFAQLIDVPAQVTTVNAIGDNAIFIGLQQVGRRTVARYPLGGGGATWQTTVDNPPESVEYLAAADIVMVESYPNGDNNQTRFTVLDAGTGKRLWSSAGSLMWSSTGSRAVQPGAEPGAVIIDQDPTGAGELRYAVMRTGRTVWSRAFPAGTQVIMTDATVLLAAADGTLTLLAQPTGVELATAQVDRLAAVGQTEYDVQHVVVVTAIGDQLLIMRQMGLLRATLSSYTLPGLAPRWSRTGQMSGYPQDCGPVLCLEAFNSGDLLGLDPSTGAVRWRAQGWQTGYPLGNGRLMGYRQTTHGYGILDAATGLLLGDLGNWTPLTGSDNTLLLTAPDMHNYRYTWLGAVNLDRAEVLPLVELEGLGTQGCDMHGNVLVCRMLDGRLRAWRYQP